MKVHPSDLACPTPLSTSAPLPITQPHTHTKEKGKTKRKKKKKRRGEEAECAFSCTFLHTLGAHLLDLDVLPQLRDALAAAADLAVEARGVVPDAELMLGRRNSACEAQVRHKAPVLHHRGFPDRLDPERDGVVALLLLDVLGERAHLRGVERAVLVDGRLELRAVREVDAPREHLRDIMQPLPSLRRPLVPRPPLVALLDNLFFSQVIAQADRAIRPFGLDAADAVPQDVGLELVRIHAAVALLQRLARHAAVPARVGREANARVLLHGCLLYTSDAADDM
eukprot:1023067-Rhodomonas_salina.1